MAKKSSKSSNLQFTEHEAEVDLVRLDLGTGKGLNRPDGFIGVDINEWEGVEVVDLRGPWPWKDDSVDDVYCNYLIHYFTATERIHFANELHRVLKSGSKAQILTPHWSASKAYADIGVQWPPVAEGWYMTLNKGWRESQNYIDTNGYTCDFEFTIGYSLHPLVLPRNVDYQQHAVTFWKEAAQDMSATLIKR